LHRGAIRVLRLRAMASDGVKRDNALIDGAIADQMRRLGATKD
jgi:hypothetical protein